MFVDERDLFVHDMECIAELMEHKTKEQIYEIMCEKSLVRSVFANRPVMKWYERLFSVPLWPVLLILSMVKWVVTGDAMLNSWAAKNAIVKWMIHRCMYK